MFLKQNGYLKNVLTMRDLRNIIQENITNENISKLCSIEQILIQTVCYLKKKY